MMTKAFDFLKKNKDVAFATVREGRPSIRVFQIMKTDGSCFEPINENNPEIGDMVETAVYAQWFPRQGNEIRYANWRQGKVQGEVDIVGLDIARQKPFWAVEIKWSDVFYNNPGNLKSLNYFMDKNLMHDALVTTTTLSGVKNLNGKNIHFMPVACYAYIVGKNTINQTKSIYGL